MLCESECRALNATYEFFINDFDPADYLIHMESQDEFSENDVDSIKEKRTRKERLFEFLRIFKRKALSLQPLIRYFESEGPEHIGRYLKEQWELMTVPNLDNDSSPEDELTPAIQQKVKQIVFRGQVPEVRSRPVRKNLVSTVADRLRRNANLDTFMTVIHGCAGSGKSLLASAVFKYHPDLLHKHYESVLWIEDGREAKDELPYLYADIFLRLRDDLSFKEIEKMHVNGDNRNWSDMMLSMIRDALIDRPNVLFVIDDVIHEESVRWLDRLGVRILMTTRDCEMTQAASSPVDLIEVSGINAVESELMFAERGYEHPPTSTLAAAVSSSDGNPAVLTKLAILGNKKSNRLLTFIDNLRTRGPSAISCVSPYKHPSISIALHQSLARTPPSLHDSLGCSTLMPSGLWIPAEVWSLVIPVDTYGSRRATASSSVFIEVSSTLSRLARLSWLREKDEGEYGHFMLPNLIAAFLAETIDPVATEHLRAAFLEKIREIEETGDETTAAAVVDEKFPQIEDTYRNGCDVTRETDSVSIVRKFLKRHSREFSMGMPLLQSEL